VRAPRSTIHIPAIVRGLMTPVDIAPVARNLEATGPERTGPGQMIPEEDVPASTVFPRMTAEPLWAMVIG